MNKTPPQANISHLSWTKILMGSIVFYGLHAITTAMYAGWACAGGWTGPMAVAAPHCSFLWEIMTWSRQWYLGIVWLVVGKCVQDFSYAADWVVYKTDIWFNQRRAMYLKSELPAESGAGNFYQEFEKTKARYKTRSTKKRKVNGGDLSAEESSGRRLPPGALSIGGFPAEEWSEEKLSKVTWNDLERVRDYDRGD